MSYMVTCVTCDGSVNLCNLFNPFNHVTAAFFTIDAHPPLRCTKTMNSKRLSPALCLTSILLLALASRADVRLPALFSDNMVLQQGMRVPLWGWAEDGEQVTITFRGRQVK